MHGLTVDHLSAVDIVTWDARVGQAQLRHVSAESATSDERDLFWALCGAGCGNFGVIVRYYFAQLPDAPDHATIGTLAWNWSDLDREELRRAAGHLRRARRGDARYRLQPPEIEPRLERADWPDPADGVRPRCRVSATIVSGRKRSFQRAESLFGQVVPSVALEKPLGGHPGYMTTLPASDAAQHVTYLEALQTLNGSGPNQFGKYKSAYMKKPFPDPSGRGHLQVVAHHAGRRSRRRHEPVLAPGGQLRRRDQPADAGVDGRAAAQLDHEAPIPDVLAQRLGTGQGAIRSPIAHKPRRTWGGSTTSTVRSTPSTAAPPTRPRTARARSMAPITTIPTRCWAATNRVTSIMLSGCISWTTSDGTRAIWSRSKSGGIRTTISITRNRSRCGDRAGRAAVPILAYLPTASRSRSTSRTGGCPNSRLYFRLNCEASS